MVMRKLNMTEQAEACMRKMMELLEGEAQKTADGVKEGNS